MTGALESLRDGRRLANISTINRVLAEARTPDELLKVDAKLAGIEEYLKRAGLMAEIRPYNEARMRARWKLGQMLSKMERGKAPGKGKMISQPAKSFLLYLKSINLQKDRAIEAQRIGTLPEAELAKVFAKAKEEETLTTISDLVDLARPYWYQASRKKKHEDIAAKAAEQTQHDILGPFPLIYADPPWKFAVYSAKGLERTPDQHYETLTDDEIADFRVQGRLVSEIAAKDAVLLLWCTSSNLVRALAIMANWDFEYKSSAVWVKDKAGLGLVFRNRHEVLLYGARGKMPGPQYQPPSVFEYPRGEHSAKPPEIRKVIERMYPDFGAKTRIELFARGVIEGWTTYGFEAGSLSPGTESAQLKVAAVTPHAETVSLP